MSETSTRNRLKLPVGSDNLLTSCIDLHTNFETIDAAISKCNWAASSAPTAGDDAADGYVVGSFWIDTTNHKIYICEDAATGAAVWRQVWPCLTDHGELSGLDDDDHPQYLKESEYTAKGDILTASGASSVVRIPAPSDGSTIIADSSQSSGWTTGDHGALGGLDDDDHPQYQKSSLMTTRGDIPFRGATAWQRLPIGAPGTVLLSYGSGADPAWGQPALIQTNYITNYGAETDTSGWVTFADAAATDPTDGTGGTPNITWTRTTSSPISGSASFLLTKDAANRQGEGVSYDFTIDSKYKAKLFNIVLRFNSNVALNEGDLRIWIYNKDAGKLIQPTVYKLPATAGGETVEVTSTFQTTADDDDYRVIIYISSTSTTAWSIKFDDIIVGPSQIACSDRVVEIFQSDAGQTILGGGVFTDRIFEDKVFSSHNAYNPSTGVFIAPRSGVYLVFSGTSFQAYAGTTAGTLAYCLYKNDYIYEVTVTFEQNGVTAGWGLFGAFLVYCNAGDTLKMAIYKQSSTDRACSTLSWENFINIISL